MLDYDEFLLDFRLWQQWHCVYILYMPFPISFYVVYASVNLFCLAIYWLDQMYLHYIFHEIKSLYVYNLYCWQRRTWTARVSKIKTTVQWGIWSHWINRGNSDLHRIINCHSKLSISKISNIFLRNWSNCYVNMYYNSLDSFCVIPFVHLWSLIWRSHFNASPFIIIVVLVFSSLFTMQFTSILSNSTFSLTLTLTR